jgi:hypothetical protein
VEAVMEETRRFAGMIAKFDNETAVPEAVSP